MSISVGGIDLTNSAINSELRIGVLEKLVERLVQVAPPNFMRQEDLTAIRNVVIEELKQKYPEAGIEYNQN